MKKIAPREAGDNQAARQENNRRKEHIARETHQKAKDQTIAETTVDIDPENRKRTHMKTPQREAKREHGNSTAVRRTPRTGKNTTPDTLSMNQDGKKKKDTEKKDNHITRKKDNGNRDTMNQDTSMKDTQNTRKDGKDLMKDMKPDTKNMTIEEMKAEKATEQEARTTTIEEKKTIGQKNDQSWEHLDTTENTMKKSTKDQRKEN